MSDRMIDPFEFAANLGVPEGIACDTDIGGNPPSITVSDPSGAVDGDLIILHAKVNNGSTVSAGEWTVNAIWNELADGEDLPAGLDARRSVWWRIKDPGDPATNDVDFDQAGDMYVCQYYVRNPHPTKPILAVSSTSEGSGDLEHYAGRMQLQADMIQVVWWTAQGTEDTGNSTLPSNTLEDDAGHGKIMYEVGTSTTQITNFQRATTGVSNHSTHSYIICGPGASVGGGTRPTSPTPDVDVQFTNNIWKDHAGTDPADFSWAPGFANRVDRIDDASGNSNNLLSASENSGNSGIWMPSTALYFGPLDLANTNQVSLATRFDIPQLAATVTSIEVVLLCELSDYDPTPENTAIIFRYNHDSFNCELQWRPSTGTVDAVLYNNTTETGRVTVDSTDVSTIPYGRHSIIATWFPSSTIALRVDGHEETDTPGATGQAAGRVLERTLGDSNWASRRESSGLQVYDFQVFANQTALTTGQKQAWETYGRLEYAMEAA